MDRTLFVLLLLNIFTNSVSVKILVVIPTPSISHQFVFRPLTQELARRGHEVTVITADPAFPKGQSRANLTEIDVYNLSYTTWRDKLKTLAVGNEKDATAQLRMIQILEALIFKEQLLTEEVQGILKQDFDLLLIEACARSALIFSHIYKVPVIWISSLGSLLGFHAGTGPQHHPLLYPVIFRQRIYNLTFWEKVREIYNQVNFEHIYKSYELEEDEMLRKIFGPDIPKLSELSNNIHMIFLNTYPIWHDNQPMPPSVVFIGGLHQTPDQELPKVMGHFEAMLARLIGQCFVQTAHIMNVIIVVTFCNRSFMLEKLYSCVQARIFNGLCSSWSNLKQDKSFLMCIEASLLALLELKSYLDDSKHGVIYVSFGTNIQSSILSSEKIKMMMNVLSTLPYDVIWKWDTEILNKPENIKVFKWVPQWDLLRHPKLKLFITQGGFQSTEESIKAGVPLIGIPMFVDQWYNAEKYVKHGIGIHLEFGTFTEDDFRNAIVTVIEDNSFRNNILRLRSLMHDQAQTPLERAVWWTEHVLRNGKTKPFRPLASHMSWADYYEVNLILVLGLGLFIAIAILLLVLNYLLKFTFIIISNVMQRFVKIKNN